MNGRRRAGVAVGDVAKFCPKTRQRFCLTPRTLPVLRIDSVGLSLTRGSDHHRITPRKPASVCLCAPQPPLGSVTRDAGGVTSTTARNLAPGEPAGSDAGFVCRMAVAEMGFHRAGRAGECVAGGKTASQGQAAPRGRFGDSDRGSIDRRRRWACLSYFDLDESLRGVGASPTGRKQRPGFAWTNGSVASGVAE